MMDEGITRNM